MVFSFFIDPAWGYERSDAFIVRIFDEKVRVLSPQKFVPRLNVIVENKTLVKVIGHLSDEKGKVLSYLSISSGGHKSIELKVKKGNKVFFTSLSPPFQKVQLLLGKKAYAIPPEKEIK
jgi:hypothetical protein